MSGLTCSGIFRSYNLKGIGDLEQKVFREMATRWFLYFKMDIGSAWV
jgi:hypothetical protein